MKDISGDPTYQAICSMESDGFKLSPDAADDTKKDPGCGTDGIAQYAAYQLASAFKAGATVMPCDEMWQGYAIANNVGRDAAELDVKCTPETILKWAGTAEASTFNSLEQSAKAVRQLWKTGIIGKVGYEDDSYFVPTKLTKTNFEGVPWQLGGYVAFISGSEKWSAVLEYLHQPSFTQSQTSTSCLAGAGPTLKCVSGSIGMPTKKESDIFSLIVNKEWDTGLSLPGGMFSTIGFAPEIDGDVRQRTYGFSLPIFLIGDKTGLTGGVRLDWTSIEHSVVVGVFVSQAFGVIPSPAPQ
jgi:hypothetical protein